MPIFEITRTETNYQYIFVEAETQEDAQNIAEHAEEWRDCNNYHSEISCVSEIDPSKTHGQYVETENGSYRIGIDEKPESEEKQKNETPVLFLIEQHGEGVFAFFPEMVHNGPFMTSYAHIGQHSACSPEYAKECKEATQDQYRELLTELTLIGYTNLKILNKDWQTEPEPKEWEILWDKLGEIPVDEDERIKENFLHFEAGTDVEDIWHWFEEKYGITLGKEIYKMR